MPPAVTTEMAKGFTLYMVKAVMSGRPKLFSIWWSGCDFRTWYWQLI